MDHISKFHVGTGGDSAPILQFFATDQKCIQEVTKLHVRYSGGWASMNSEGERGEKDKCEDQ